MELLRVSPSTTGIKVELGYYKEWWKLCGNTFSSGILLDSKLDSAVIAYPDLDDAKPHALAFIVAGATGSNRWEKIEIILFSANEKGDKVFAYTLGGGEGSVREFTACNQFVNYGAYLSVADTEKSILYVTAMPETPTPAWAYKIVPMDAMLGYIVKRLTLEELDAAATAEQQARDELAELRAENHRLGCDLAQAEREVYRERLRANNLVITLDRFGNWVEQMLENRFLRFLLWLSRPMTTMAVVTVVQDRHLEGVTLAGLINGRSDPVD